MVTSGRVARDALRIHVLFLRAKLRLPQTTLAKRAGISRALLSSIEQGTANVTLDVLSRLADALDTSAARLLEPVNAGASDADVARRLNDGPEAFVDADDFLTALDDSTAAAGEPKRYSRAGRRKAAVPA